MNTENPSYFSIIPASVRYDKNLSANEKLLFGEISALCNKDGYCWATNAYFARLYEVSIWTVSRWISNLEKHSYIKTETLKSKGNQRHISLVIEPTQGVLRKSARVLRKGAKGIAEKRKTPIAEKRKQNNINMNSIINRAFTNEQWLSWIGDKFGESGLRRCRAVLDNYIPVFSP